jgi:hypothetical protein
MEREKKKSPASIRSPPLFIHLLFYGPIIFGCTETAKAETGGGEEETIGARRP